MMIKLSFVFIIFYFTVVFAEFFPGDIPRDSDPYLPNVITSVRECSLRHYKWGKSTVVAPVGGVEAFLREFPHIAAIGWINNETVHWNCGGSLITEMFILTAAHCTFWEGAQPNVARLGDLNLESEHDDKYAQQREIDEVISHPNYKFSAVYDDIALLRLKTPIMTHNTVMPVCLWPTFDFNFEKLEAAGWGLTSYGGSKANKLLKVHLHALSNEECSKSYPKRRKLKQGLIQSQVCAISKGEVQMDTCEGDSGGNLEIKLYGQAKLIPFLVGVTSFGIGCASGSPGVYTRVSSYREWIESTVNETFDPIKCALRNIDLRLFEPSFYESDGSQYDDGTGNFESTTLFFDSTKFFVQGASSQYSVSVTNEKANNGINCSGSIIDERFILTSATCTNRFPSKPDTVSYTKEEPSVQKFDIDEVFVHEKYDNSYNDIALIRLKDKIELHKIGQLACPWPLEEVPNRFDAYGFGPQNINIYGDSFDIIHLTMKSDLVARDICSDKIKKVANLTNGVLDTQLCSGNPYFIVPDSCEVDVGGPLQRLAFDQKRYFPFLFGINSIGVDCGFGIPLVTSKVSSFIPWMDSIIYGNVTVQEENAKTEEIAINFKECVNKNLPFREDFQKSQNDREFQTSQTFESSVAFIEHFSKNDPGKNCEGAIIHPKFVITTARCASTKKRNSQILIRIFKRQIQSASKVHIHPNYDAATGENDIALLQTGDSFKFDEFTSPACLWYNQTHLPLFLSKILIADHNGTSPFNQPMFPIINEDCETSLSSRLFCAYAELTCEDWSDDIVKATLCSTKNCPKNHGELVLSFEIDQNKVTPVLVGLASSKNNCNIEKPLTFTRISAFKHWIESILSLDKN